MKSLSILVLFLALSLTFSLKINHQQALPSGSGTTNTSSTTTKNTTTPIASNNNNTSKIIPVIPATPAAPATPVAPALNDDLTPDERK